MKANTRPDMAGVIFDDKDHEIQRKAFFSAGEVGWPSPKNRACIRKDNAACQKLIQALGFILLRVIPTVSLPKG
jgi:hypothetical protein